jgi:large subunit ribosomal protein L29
MKPSELRDMTDAELEAKHTELADALFHLRLRRATSQLPSPAKVRQTRRDLARVKTLLGERARGKTQGARA